MVSVQKNFAFWIGLVLVIVGIIGFFNNPVFSIFPVNTAHNWVHIITGLILLYGSWAYEGINARYYNQTLGVIYLIVTIIGFAVGLDFLMVSSGSDYDNYLHLVLGLVLAGVGFFAEE